MVLQLALTPFALTQSHLKGKDESVVTLAIDAYRAALDFADALHHASAHGCERFLAFDDRGFAPPDGRLKLKPAVMLPAR